METKRIIVRQAEDDFYALEIANAAAQLGWRVIGAFSHSNYIHVWVEAPGSADPDELDDAITSRGNRT